MAWKILITARAFQEVGAAAEKRLRNANFDVVIAPRFGPLPADELLELLPGIDAVLASLDHFTDQVLSSPAARELKLISRWGVGYDSIDINAATAAGVIVAYAPGFLDHTVADFAFALILSLARRIHECHLSMRSGEWQPRWSTDFHGKTLGLIGCGRIGQAVARRAFGFGVRVLGYDTYPSPEAKALGIEFVSLDPLLTQSDFISLHAALTPENRGMLGESEFRKMKPTVLFINTARGALVKEEVLLRALREHWIAGAALDAFAVEPLPQDHPLRSCPNVLLTPHQASWARDTGERVSAAAAQAIVDVAEGRAPRFVVNPEVLKSPRRKAPLSSIGTSP